MRRQSVPAYRHEAGDDGDGNAAAAGCGGGDGCPCDDGDCGGFGGCGDNNAAAADYASPQKRANSHWSVHIDVAQHHSEACRNALTKGGKIGHDRAAVGAKNRKHIESRGDWGLRFEVRDLRLEI